MPGLLTPPLRDQKGAPLLRVTKISKSFAGAKALDEVSLEVHSGEILAVVGQNGSGKSTLVKVLAGVYERDPGGDIEVRDASGALVGVRGAHHESLHFIHQDLGLLPMLSTTENLALGRRLGRRALLPGNRNDEHRRAAGVVGRFGVSIDVRAPVAELSPAEKAVVAIARAMDSWTRPDGVLVLDEPTAAFHSGEVDRLFGALRRVAGQGAGVLFISHRLDEVHALADRVVVLRDGRKVADELEGHFDEASLVTKIVGTAVHATRRVTTPTEHRDRVPVLAVEGLRAKKLRGIGFEVGVGEILGVTGVLGSGREELCALLFGATRRSHGAVRVGGEALPPGDMATAIDRGVAYVPADRRQRGAVMVMSVRENLTLPSLHRFHRRFGRVDAGKERRECRRWATAIGLRPLQPEKPMATFSGGNQQKVVLAKWLLTEPRLLLLEEPTQGVDVGAKAAIYDLVMKAASRGTAVLVSSSDTKEVATVCDRALVLEGGRVKVELAAGGLTEEALLSESLGGGAEREARAVNGGRWAR